MNQHPDYQCFLDMDGVLVDWNKGTHILHGLSWEEKRWPYEFGPGGWYFYKHGLGMSTSELFNGQDRKFWADLDWTPYGRDVLAVCEKYFGNTVCLLTSPFDQPGVVDGRKDWIKREMPEYTKRHLIGDYKNACAHPKAILIDDCQNNIDEWVKAGGLGVLLPRPYNNSHPTWSRPDFVESLWLDQALEQCLYRGAVPVCKK
jgi:hypothetical protein